MRVVSGNQAGGAAAERRTVKHLTVASLALLGLVSCSDPPNAPKLTAQTQIVDGGTAISSAYRLAPGDDLILRFPYQPDLNDEVNVGPDGKVALQYIDTVKLAGLTVDDARETLRQHYAQVIKEPTLSISIKTYALQQIYVSGQVTNPGLVRDTVPLTLSHAIAEAGGLKLATARTKQVVLVRHTAEGQIVYYQIDMSNGVTGSGVDPLLQSYDLVYVPETRISELSDFIATNLTRIFPVGVTTQFNP